jgi:hypothetical protein
VLHWIQSNTSEKFGNMWICLGGLIRCQRTISLRVLELLWVVISGGRLVALTDTTEKTMANDWKHERAAEHIKKKLEDVKEVVIKDYVRDKTLENIKTNEAYKVDGVHLYADILNMSEILGTTRTEGVTSHKRTLRFLNQHYRAVSRILAETDVKRVDFHNQRLHAIVTKVQLGHGC